MISSFNDFENGNSKYIISNQNFQEENKLKSIIIK